MKNLVKSITLSVAILIFLATSPAGSILDAVVDSDMTFEEAIAGTKAPQNVIDDLVLLNVEYYSFDERLHRGQLVVHKDVEEDVARIFDLIRKERFPVAKVVPIVAYDWSDDASMLDNNTSAFNYRFIAGTKRLSQHSFGRAVDINPFNNPVVYPSGKVSPDGAKYDPNAPGAFTEDSPIVKEFKRLGWRWGKYFTKYDDNHHFDKVE